MTVSPENASLYMTEAEYLYKHNEFTGHFPTWVEQLHHRMNADQQLAIVIEAPTQPNYFYSRPGNYIQIHNTGTDGFGRPLFWATPMNSTQQQPREILSQPCVLIGVQEPRGGLATSVIDMDMQSSRVSKTQHRLFESMRST